MENTILYKGYTIKVEKDDYSNSPRKDWDPISTIATFNCKTIENECEENMDPEYDGDNFEAIKADYVFTVKMVAILPLHFKEYSCDCNLNTDGNGNQIGFVYISKKMWKSHMGVTDESSEWWQKYHKGKSIADVARSLMKNEIKTYNQYLNGECYSFSIEEDDFKDSCFGYYGNDHEESGLLEIAKDSIDCHLNWLLKAKLKVLKGYLKAKVPIIYRFAS